MLGAPSGRAARGRTAPLRLREPAFANAQKQKLGLLGTLLLSPESLLQSPPPHSFSRGRWAVKPLSGKPSSRSSRLGERPAWSWNRQPPPAGKGPALSQVPHKSRPAPRRLTARGVPRGRVPWSFHSRPRDPRKEAGGGPWSLSFGARVGTRQVARRRSPVAARARSPFAWKAVAAPRAQPRATGRSLHLDEREGSPHGRRLGGSRPQRGSASFREEARGPEGRRRPPRFPRRYAPGCPRVPHGRRRRRRIGSRFPGDRRGGGGGGGPLPSVARPPGPDERGVGAGTPAPGCVQPQTYSMFPRSCDGPKTVTCTSPLGGRGSLSPCVQKRRFDVSHLAGERSNRVALGRLWKTSASSRSPRGTGRAYSTPPTGFGHHDFSP